MFLDLTRTPTLSAPIVLIQHSRLVVLTHIKQLNVVSVEVDNVIAMTVAAASEFYPLNAVYTTDHVLGHMHSIRKDAFVAIATTPFTLSEITSQHNIISLLVSCKPE